MNETAQTLKCLILAICRYRIKLLLFLWINCFNYLNNIKFFNEFKGK